MGVPDIDHNGTQLDTLLRANLGRLEAMLGCLGRGEPLRLLLSANHTVQFVLLSCREGLLQLHKWPQDHSRLSIISVVTSSVAR